MNTPINDIVDGFNAEAASMRAERTRIETQIARLNRKLDLLPNYGATALVGRLVDALRPHFPEHSLDVLGPFGLANETAIHIRDVDDHTVSSISFLPDRNEQNDYSLKRVEHGNPTANYPPNSLGALNGFNRRSAALPATIEDLAQYLRDQLEERAPGTS